MKYPIIAVIYFVFIANVISQTCNCSISQVENNTVESCEITIGTTVVVNSVSQFYSALGQANSNGGNMTILFEDGTYPLASTSQYPYITASNMVLRSLSGNRDAVIITGQGMQDVSPNTEIGFYLVGNNITVADLTIRDVGNHAIATVSDGHLIHNVRIQNTYEQMIKGNSSGDGADNCIVQCSLFEYTAGIGPQYYIGGLDIHEGDNWLVRDNIFKDIASPSGSLAEHAIHFWDNSADNIVERNMIEGCDRGIGFGLGSSPNSGGIIRNNMIYNDGSQAFDDVGISLETSPNTKVYNNTVHIDYFNAIEYRFTTTTGVIITNNLTNQNIASRNGGQATLTTNYTNGLFSYYENPTAGNLRLVDSFAQVYNQGTNLGVENENDIDQITRPEGNQYDIGAYEFPIDDDQENRVLNTLDKGAGSLRDVILQAEVGDTIFFDSALVNSVINLTSGEIVIDKDVVIMGINPLSITISGTNSSRIFHIDSGIQAELHHLILANGYSLTNGGAIENAGMLELYHIVFRGNMEGGSPKAFTNLPTGNFLIGAEVEIEE